MAERRGEAHFLAVDDVVGEEVLDGFFEDVFLFGAADLHTVGQGHGEGEELMIEEGDAAFDGGGHAHLILLHEELNQVGFLVRVEHAGEEGGLGPGVPVFEIVAVDAVGRRRQQALLFGEGEGTIEVVEEERFDRIIAGDEGVGDFAAEVGTEQGGGGDPVADAVAEATGEKGISGGGAGIPGVPMVAFIATEDFVAAFAGEDDFDVLGGEAGDEEEGDGRGPGDGFVFVPDEAGEDGEEFLAADDDFVVLGAELGGDLGGVGEFGVLGFLVTDGEGVDFLVGGFAADEGGDGAGVEATA